VAVKYAVQSPPRLVAAAALTLLVSCLDLGAPEGVLSITPLLLPSPGMVVGDTMRDSAGAAAPLRVYAFNANGDTIAATTTFITLDTTAHLAGGTLLVADFVGNARVVGTVGSLQTLPETVKVTLEPDTLQATDSTRHERTFSVLGGDTLVTSAELTTRVTHLGGASPSDVDAVIVRYEILSAPPAKGTIPTVSLVNGSLLSNRDTTTAGRASRAARLRVSQLTSTALDSAVIRATASHRGISIGVVTFTVVFRNQ